MTTSAPGRFSLEHGMRLPGLAMARPETFTDSAFLLFLGPLAKRLKKLVRWLVPVCFGAMLASGDALHAKMDVHAQTRVGEVVVETDAAGAEPFGRIGGMAIAADERVWVLDRQASTVYLIDTAGDLAATRGREGGRSGRVSGVPTL